MGGEDVLAHLPYGGGEFEHVTHPLSILTLGLASQRCAEQAGDADHGKIAPSDRHHRQRLGAQLLDELARVVGLPSVVEDFDVGRPEDRSIAQEGAHERVEVDQQGLVDGRFDESFGDETRGVETRGVETRPVRARAIGAVLGVRAVHREHAETSRPTAGELQGPVDLRSR